MRILVFGGSFDPPHVGHLRLLTAALKEKAPDLAYVVPAHQSPLKGKTRAAPAERLALVRAALDAGLRSADRRRARVEGFELARGRAVYTYETLRHLKRRHPGAELVFLAGSDSLASFSRWRRPDELARACRWLTGLRPGARRPRGPGLPDVAVLEAPMPDVSSTEVRARILSQESVAGMVPEAVAARIRARELYGLDRHRLLAAVLSPSRYHHSVCVARRARELAVLHALDLERAALAGLLHDCGRALTPDALVRYARRHRLSAPLLAETAAEAPMLLHAYVGEALARRRYGVSDPLVLRAIRTHTLGALDMSAFEKLVYAADACSADRTYPEARPIRAAARRDLDAGLARAVNAKLVHALSEGSWIHPLGIELWNLLEERA